MQNYLFYQEKLEGVIRTRQSNQRMTDNTMVKRKRQKDKQRFTKHTQKTTDRVTRTPYKTGGELRCSGRVTVPAPHMASIVLLLLQTR
jgi:hypothetical protein